MNFREENNKRKLWTIIEESISSKKKNKTKTQERLWKFAHKHYKTYPYSLLSRMPLFGCAESRWEWEKGEMIQWETLFIRFDKIKKYDFGWQAKLQLPSIVMPEDG